MFNKMFDEITELSASLATANQAKDNAYSERNQLVAALSKMALRHGGDAWLTKHEGPDWDDDWRNIVVIIIDDKQMTWHIMDSEMPMFEHLKGQIVRKAYDGHSTEEKYKRLATIYDWYFSNE